MAGDGTCTFQAKYLTPYCIFRIWFGWSCCRSNLRPIHIVYNFASPTPRLVLTANLLPLFLAAFGFSAIISLPLFGRSYYPTVLHKPPGNWGSNHSDPFCDIVTLCLLRSDIDIINMPSSLHLGPSEVSKQFRWTPTASFRNTDTFVEHNKFQHLTLHSWANGIHQALHSRGIMQLYITCLILAVYTIYRHIYNIQYTHTLYVRNMSINIYIYTYIICVCTHM